MAHGGNQDYYIYEDDIIVDYNEHVATAWSNINVVANTKTKQTLKLWNKNGPHVIIPFAINKPPLSDQLNNTIHAAMKQFTDKTCIR